MKFGDKLIALRKKNGLSQEELAEKLNVSRQSVSKWESNNTYPETDKIVQICNLFNCSMDDLINDKITDIEQLNRKEEKNNINLTIDSLLSFITKTIDMFSSMTFMSGLKCVIELLILIGILFLGGNILASIFSSLISNLFSFIDNYYIIRNILNSFLSIILFILIFIIVVHVFKIRYLDYFDKVRENVEEENKNIDKTTTKEQNKKIKRKEQIRNLIIRDKEPFAFLSIFSKIAIWIIKFCALCVEFGVIVLLFCLVFVFVILIPISFHSLLLFGIHIVVLASIVVSVLMIMILFNFILNKNINIKLAIWIFIGCIIVMGIGTGIGVIGLKDIEVQEATSENDLALFEEKIYYSDDIYLEHNNYDIEYIVDDTIVTDEIYLQAKYNDKMFKIDQYWTEEDHMNGYSLYLDSNLNFKYLYDIFLSNLKNNIILDYGSSSIKTLQVRANKKTIDKLLNNLSKIYLYNKINTENGFITTKYRYKVVVDNYGCDVDYNAISDTIQVDSTDCRCERKSIETYQGSRIIYKCMEDDNESDVFD